MHTATWSPGCTPALRSTWLTRLAAASSSAKVWVNPDAPMMNAGLSGWVSRYAPGNMAAKVLQRPRPIAGRCAAGDAAGTVCGAMNAADPLQRFAVLARADGVDRCSLRPARRHRRRGRRARSARGALRADVRGDHGRVVRQRSAPGESGGVRRTAQLLT